MEIKRRIIIAIIFLLTISTVFFALADGCISAVSGIVINEVFYNSGESSDTGNEWIKLYNNSDKAIILTGYELYPSGIGYYIFPDFTLDSHFFVTIHLRKEGMDTTSDLYQGNTPKNNMSNTAGSVALFSGHSHNERTIADFLEYGKEKQTWESDAVKAGIWTAGDFIKNVSTGGNSIGLKKDGEDNNSSSDWQEYSIKKNSSSDSGLSSGIEIKKDDDIFANLYANFEVEYIGATDATKYTWNFGDGHKSYLQKTKHKYEKSGAYQASITIRGDKKGSKNFEVEVEDYEAPKVKITNFMPNPKGKDTAEWIEIKNNSKKKIDLVGWSIATGWEKLINHPIRKKFVLKKGESKKLTKKSCSFTLNNKKTKIELRDPTGETAQKLKYERTKNKIEDDETFSLVGKEWVWDNPNPEQEKEKEHNKSSLTIKNNVSETKTEIKEINIVSDSEIQTGIGKYTTDPTWLLKKEKQIKLISFNTNIKTPKSLTENQGRVLGASIQNTAPKKHWAAVFWDSLWKTFNSQINKLFLVL